MIGTRLDPPRPACTVSREVRRNGRAKRYRALRAQALPKSWRGGRRRLSSASSSMSYRDYARVWEVQSPRLNGRGTYPPGRLS